MGARVNTYLKACCAVVLGATLLISGCRSTGPTLPDDPTFARITDPSARRQLRNGKPLAASDIYTTRAENTSDPAERQDYLLVAAEILFDRAMIEPGIGKLEQVPMDLETLELQHRRDILVAKSRLFEGNAEDALLALPDPELVESPLHRARIFETRAQSYNALQDPDNELIARIQLEQQIAEPVIIERSHEQIWQMLSTQSLSTLRGMTTNVRSDVYQGWIELALAYASGGTDAAKRGEALGGWQDRFADHPANASFLARLYEPDEFGGFTVAGDSINQIAVLLPLSGRSTATVAAAIRDGMVAAYEQSRSRQLVPSLRFYDVGENAAFARTAYENAVNDGADAIIGPLRKQAVSAIVTQRNIPVPTITLNTVDTQTARGETSNVIQFGLSPEDEAQAAASRAVALSLSNAVVFQSDDSRGDREARAFQDTMFQYGADVVHVAVLEKDKYDYSEEIKDALQITASDERFRTLSSVLGERLFFEPSIRNDVDVVFLAITSEQARSVRPQLDFFHASGVTRIGTSRVAATDDNQKNNRDLNSIYYPEAPWILRKSMQDDPLRQDILKNFENANGIYAKLYALGADAFRVMTNLDAISQGQRLEGYTGDLELGSDGRIKRHLDWAQYQEGVSQPVERLEAPALNPIQSSTLN